MTQLWLILIAAVLSCGSTPMGKHALFKSKYGQLVTSSTLRWVHIVSGESIPSDAVPSGTGNNRLFVCRAEHHGMLIVGQTTPEGAHCTVGFVAELFRKHKFEILLNIDLSAKLEWRSYNKFAGVPDGAVAAVDDTSGAPTSSTVYIGRHLSTQSGQWQPGAVEVPKGSPYSTFGFMRIFDPETGASAHLSSGDVLVEVEPIGYELQIHPTDSTASSRNTKTTRQDVVLAKSSLFRFDEGRDAEARLQKVLVYHLEKSEYYGQVAGMIRALPTLIRLPKGESHSLRWGLPEKSRQEETLMVGFSLKHFTAVDVSVVGVKVTEEEGYKGTLTSIFADGSKRQRSIEGISQKIYLNNIRPEYSRMYQIKETVFVREGTTTTTIASVDTTAASSGLSTLPGIMMNSSSQYDEDADVESSVNKRDQSLDPVEQHHQKSHQSPIVATGSFAPSLFRRTPWTILSYILCSFLFYL